MAELVCDVRSMSETIVAAVTSFGLFMAANWGTATLLDFFQGYFSLPRFLKSNAQVVDQILGHTMLSFVVPFVSYVLSVINAYLVIKAKRSLVKRGGVKSLDHGSIAIITICPVYIRFPASALTYSTDEQQRGLSLEIERGYKSVSLKAIVDLCPLELRPCPAAANSNAINSNADNRTAMIDIDEEDSTQWMCYRLPDGIDEKVVLLGLGLTPTYKELRFLRSRSRFQTIVTALQAVGYMLTVIQRAAHNLAISPLEAFVTFLCIITSIQLLLELYACGHYQCPILLRLNTQQFCLLRDYRGTDDDYEVSAMESAAYDLGFLFLGVSPWLLILGLSMYYFVHYVHTYLICSISALLFFLAHCILGIGTLYLFCTEFEFVVSFIFVLYYGLYTSSMIVAFVSTIMHWKAFQEANQKPWYSWILPHVSS